MTSFENCVHNTRLIFVNGPGKWDLMVGLGDRKIREFTIKDLKTQNTKKIKVRIKMIEECNYSEEAWIVGCISNYTNPNKKKSVLLCGIYNSKCRKTKPHTIPLMADKPVSLDDLS